MTRQLILFLHLKVLLANGYIMWDIIQSCSIRNSDDTSISDYVPNDIPGKNSFQFSCFSR
jgi:hypothetical protein